MKKIISAVAAALMLAAGALEIPNGDFAAGQAAWTPQPAGSKLAIESASDGTNSLTISADKANSGATSGTIELAPEEAAGAFTLSLELQADAIESGVFGISVYPLDKAGKRINQVQLYLRSAKNQPMDWTKLKLAFGNGTAKKLPEGTAALQLRFSFYEKKGNVTGKVGIRGLQLEGVPQTK